jgi:hypothetical protein
MRIKRMNRIMRALMPDVIAITLAPFGIFHRPEKMPWQLLNHELIHWKQQMEMLIIPFYLWYFIEWLIKLPKWGGIAYYRISFEKEAYANEKDGQYLNNRKHFTWFKYL